jgi:hypothetical protein
LEISSLFLMREPTVAWRTPAFGFTIDDNATSCTVSVHLGRMRSQSAKQEVSGELLGNRELGE